MKRLPINPDLLLAVGGGAACLAVGLLFMWRDRHDGEHGLRALAFGSFFAALFVASHIAARWVERRRRRGPRPGFAVKPDTRPNDPGRDARH